LPEVIANKQARWRRIIARYRLEAYATLPEVIANKQARWRRMIARYRLEAYATLPEVVADKQARWRGVIGPVQAGSLCYFARSHCQYPSVLA
jgi:hypothetical protein